MSSTGRSLRWAAACGAVLMAALACGGSSNTGGTVTFKGTKNIGLSIALTGQSALYGHAISQSMKLAADEINAKGGINGYKVNADILDDATQVANAVNNIKSLILQDNVVAMLGNVTSAQCQATSPIAKQNKVIYIAATCNSYQLTTEPDLVNPYYITQALQVDPNFFQKYPMTTLASVDELQSLGSKYPLGMHLYQRAPFFALNNPAMNGFVTKYHDRYGEFPSDWAVMDYDAMTMYAKAANAAGSFDADKVRSQIVGHSFDSLRGYKFTIRDGDQQANAGETVGTTGDSGGKYPFPILVNSTTLKGDDLLMPTAIMQQLQAGQCEKTPGTPNTTDFSLCPAWKTS